VLQIFFLFFFFCFGLAYSISNGVILEDQLAMVKFTLQRIDGSAKTPGDVDAAHLVYLPHILHARCLGYKTMMFLIIQAGDYNSFKFHPTVYFHLNVHDDGWVHLIELHSGARSEWEFGRKSYAMEVEDAEAMGEKVEENTVIKRFGLAFPHFP
jgi:hypothetical protein